MVVSWKAFGLCTLALFLTTETFLQHHLYLSSLSLHQALSISFQPPLEFAVCPRYLVMHAKQVGFDCLPSQWPR
jgi:hypothetical protein